MSHFFNVPRLASSPKSKQPSHRYIDRQVLPSHPETTHKIGTRVYKSRTKKKGKKSKDNMYRSFKECVEMLIGSSAHNKLEVQLILHLSNFFFFVQFIWIMIMISSKHPLVWESVWFVSEHNGTKRRKLSITEWNDPLTFWVTDLLKPVLQPRAVPGLRNMSQKLRPAAWASV